jgi:hypothetical protein
LKYSETQIAGYYLREGLDDMKSEDIENNDESGEVQVAIE